MTEIVSLKSICNQIGDGLHGTPIYDNNGDYAFINGTNLVNGKIQITNSTKMISKYEAEKHFRYLGNNTILLSINGTLGNIAEYNKEKIVLGKSACFINIKDDVDKQFIKYVLQDKPFRKYLKICSTGSTIKNISPSQVGEYKFLLPKKEIQLRITNILGSLDKKIEINQKKIAELEETAKLIYDYWFVQFDFLFFQGKVDFDYRYPIERTYTTMPIKLAMKNDILLSVRAPVGDVNIALTDCCIGRGVAAIRGIYSSYTYYTIKNLKPIFDKYNNFGTTFGSINKDDLKNIMVVQVPDDIQKEFYNTVNSIDLLIEKLSIENIKLICLRDWLLPMLMNGQVEVIE